MRNKKAEGRRKILFLASSFLLLTSSLFAQRIAIKDAENRFRIGPLQLLADGSRATGLTPGSFTLNYYRNGGQTVSVTPAACVFSTGTATSDTTAPANDSTVSIQSIDELGTVSTITYTFKTVLTGAAYEVKIGTAAVSLDNLKCAINATGCGGAGVDFGTGTVKHPIVTAGTNTDTTQAVTSALPGTLYNSLTTTASTSPNSHITWGAGTLQSGTASGCMSEIANGIYWWASTSAFDKYGDVRVDFNYTGVSAHWEDFRVESAAAFSANYVSPASIAGVWDYPVASATAGSMGESVARVDTPISTVNSGVGAISTLIGTPAVDVITDLGTHDTAIKALLPAALVGGRIDASVGAYASGQAPLQPTTAGRTLDVTATGAAGVDWANVENPSSTVNLSGTTISVAGSVTGAVGSIGSGGIASTSFSNNSITAAAVAADAVTEIQSGLSTLTASGAENAVWNATLASHLGAGSTGAALNAASSAGDPWSTALPGAYGAGTAGKIIGDNLNATVSSRASTTDVAGVQSDTDNIQTRLPAALIGGRMNSNVGAYDTGQVPLQPTVAGRTIDVTATGAAGIDWGNVENQSTAVTLSGTSTKALEPTVASRTLDVSAGGEAGVDWGNVGTPGATVNLSGTTISVAGSVTGAVGSVTGAVGSVTALGTQAKLDAVYHRGIITGTATAGGNNTITLAGGESATNNKYAFWLITLTSGTGAGQTAVITAYNGTTKVATILNQGTTTGNWHTNPINGTTYSLIPFKR